MFQNLIDNALNYSMDGTRIFIDLKEEKNYIRLEMKNTASYEMNFTPDEITERFTRGDKSRTDGGNGLGLSIAKTLRKACGGVIPYRARTATFQGSASVSEIYRFRRFCKNFRIKRIPEDILYQNVPPENIKDDDKNVL